jgi:uncharacterized protein with NRDE domain
MSVVAIAWRADPYFPLVLLYNRSELHTRPTVPASWQGDVLAGRDLQAGGSWLAVSRDDGRFALVTNHRDGTPPPADAPSRGNLPLDYLASGDEPVAFTRRFMRDKGPYAPFNLIVAHPRQAHYAATRSRLPLALTEGIHTLSDVGLLDQKSPQGERLGTLFGAYIKAAGGHVTLLDGYPKLRDAQALYGYTLPMPEEDLRASDIAAAAFTMLADRQDDVFACGAERGTRSSTVFIMSREGGLHFEERSFNAAGDPTGTVLETWQQDPAVFGAPA